MPAPTITGAVSCLVVSCCVFSLPSEHTRSSKTPSLELGIAGGVKEINGESRFRPSSVVRLWRWHWLLERLGYVYVLAYQIPASTPPKKSPSFLLPDCNLDDAVGIGVYCTRPSHLLRRLSSKQACQTHCSQYS